MGERLTLEWWEDDGWLVGRLREVPGVFSQGETLEDPEANVRAGAVGGGGPPTAS